MLGNEVPERTTNFGWPAVQQVRDLCFYFLSSSFLLLPIFSLFSNNATRHDLLLISNQRAKADNAAMSYENQYCSDTASLLDFTGIEATAHLHWFKGPTSVINNDHTRVICSELYS